MPVRGVYHQSVNPRLYQCARTSQIFGSHAYGRSHTQASVFILVGIRVSFYLCYVAERYQPFQRARFVHNRQFFYLVLLQYLLGLVQSSTHGARYQFGAHYPGQRLVALFFKTQVAVGHYAYQFFIAVHDRYPAYRILMHAALGIGHRSIGRQHYRIEYHSAFLALYGSDHLCLFGHAHVLVYHAYAAFLSHSYGHSGLCHRVHSRRHHRGVEHYVARKTAFYGNVFGYYRGIRRNQ